MWAKQVIVSSTPQILLVHSIHCSQFRGLHNLNLAQLLALAHHGVYLVRLLFFRLLLFRLLLLAILYGFVLTSPLSSLTLIMPTCFILPTNVYHFTYIWV